MLVMLVQIFTLLIPCTHLRLPMMIVHTFLCLRSSPVYTSIRYAEGTATNVADDNDCSHIFVLYIFLYLHLYLACRMVKVLEAGRGRISGGLLCPGAIFLGGKYLGGRLSGGRMSRGHFSSGANIRGHISGGLLSRGRLSRLYHSLLRHG